MMNPDMEKADLGNSNRNKEPKDMVNHNMYNIYQHNQMKGPSPLSKVLFSVPRQ